MPSYLITIYHYGEHLKEVQDDVIRTGPIAEDVGLGDVFTEAQKYRNAANKRHPILNHHYRIEKCDSTIEPVPIVAPPKLTPVGLVELMTLIASVEAFDNSSPDLRNAPACTVIGDLRNAAHAVIRSIPL